MLKTRQTSILIAKVDRLKFAGGAQGCHWVVLGDPWGSLGAPWERFGRPETTNKTGAPTL